MNYDTKFKQELKKKMEDKQLSPNSISLYLRNLEKLNDDQPLKDFKFLNNVDGIVKKLNDYKENTKRGYLISVCSALGTDKATKPKQQLYDKYFELMVSKNKELKAVESSNEKTDTQKTNWIDWNDVEAKYTELKTECEAFSKRKEINEHLYNQLLSLMVLSLYTCNPPRRNEYQKMNIIKNEQKTSGLLATMNYLDYDNKLLILNSYKTAKSGGQKKLPINDELYKVINMYIKFHPVLKGKKPTKETNTPFLVYYNGKPLDAINSITRILNRVFGRKVSSSMLRHSYLSSKYAKINEEQKEDAEAMGHSTSMQKDYIKN